MRQGIATGDAMNVTLRALNRFGLGARPGEGKGIDDPRAWLRAQLLPQAALLNEDLPTFEGIGPILLQSRQAQQSQDRKAAQSAREASRRVLDQEARALFRRRLTSDAPFLERLVAFWSNHLAVSIRGKQGLVPLAGHYERSVVRPHVLGRFSDMVLASARHPAMLLYLDNARSIGPQSPAGRRLGRFGQKRGLNENYARELLELHTVGVDGGYSQQDVEQLALVLTGWTLEGVRSQGRGREVLGFAFRPGLHEPGAKTVMGSGTSASGFSEGEQIIEELCQREATGRFLATKLVRHFVSDDPPAAAVAKIAGVFSSTGGDLEKTSRALIELPEAWDPARRKFRTPQDWLIASFRALGVREAYPRLAEVLVQLRQPLWSPSSPQGYGDRLQDWGDPDSLMNRAELAQTLALRLDIGKAAGEKLLEIVDVPPVDPLVAQVADPSVPDHQKAALALAGPAFQWR